MDISPNELKLLLKNARYIFAAVCGVVVFLMLIPIPAPRWHISSTTLVVFMSLIAGALLFLSFWLPPKVLSRVLGQKKPQDLKSFVDAWLPSFLVNVACKEAAMVSGFFLSFLSGQDGYRYLFGLAVLTALSYSWPKTQTLEKLLRSS